MYLALHLTEAVCLGKKGRKGRKKREKIAKKEKEACPFQKRQEFAVMGGKEAEGTAAFNLAWPP